MVPSASRFAAASCPPQDAVCARPASAWHSVNAPDVDFYAEPHRSMAPSSARPDYQKRCEFNHRFRRPQADYCEEGRGVGHASYPHTPVHREEAAVRGPLPSATYYNCGAPGHITRFCERRQPSRHGRPASGFWRNDRRDPDADRTSQLDRLKLHTKLGKDTLRLLGCHVEDYEKGRKRISPQLRNYISVAALHASQHASRTSQESENSKDQGS
ncbi:hypothetical protein HPB50_000946 [Hyalomma asiaticum]|uniref:Uncharacterized protein n=1 Tax=Hyalomma asiaticum TaxID=266040 RepID=A0ACB7T773_HYAAI|nr:hypothetical protein HPB50_000946 [Hyalomma asiaticum]